VRKVIEAHCHRNKVESSVGMEGFKQLQKEAFDPKTVHELLEEVPGACQRLWTSAVQINGKEFCSILNEAIRVDDSECMAAVATLARGINLLCASTRKDPVKVSWPSDYLLYRGGGLPDDKTSFFQPGKVFRVPMYLATSLNKDVAEKFCRRAMTDGFPPVLWILHLNNKYGCYHVNFVDRTNVPGESEFLFVAYSVFTVMSVEKIPNPTWMNPIVIHLDVAVDNMLFENQKLPLSPWN